MILAAVFSGLFFGAIYNHNRKLPTIVIYHQFVTGVGFLLTLFLFRLLSTLFGAAAVANPVGWVGILILWAIFCFFILAGYKIRQ